MSAAIEVRLIDPAGLVFLSDDFDSDGAGYLLRKPAVKARGADAARLHEADSVYVPFVNVQYAGLYDG